MFQVAYSSFIESDLRDTLLGLLEVDAVRDRWKVSGLEIETSIPDELELHSEVFLAHTGAIQIRLLLLLLYVNE